MHLEPLFDFELRYTALEMIDYGAGGQIYGTMEGSVAGDRLRGRLRLTNLAQRRPDGANLPTLRGMLDTDDGASVWIELDGIATLRAADQARVFVTAMRFRAGHERYRWLDTAVGVLEGVLDRVSVGGTARGRGYRCEATMS